MFLWFWLHKVNCDKMDEDRPRQPANRNCYRLSRVSWALAQIFCWFPSACLFPSRTDIDVGLQTDGHARRVLRPTYLLTQPLWKTSGWRNVCFISWYIGRLDACCCSMEKWNCVGIAVKIQIQSSVCRWSRCCCCWWWWWWCWWWWWHWVLIQQVNNMLQYSVCAIVCVHFNHSWLHHPPVCRHRPNSHQHQHKRLVHSKLLRDSRTSK